MGTIGARKAAEILKNVQAVLGIEWLAAAQAVDLRGKKQLGVGTTEAYELIRRHVQYLEEDRIFYKDQKTAADMIASGELLSQVEKSVGALL